MASQPPIGHYFFLTLNCDATMSTKISRTVTRPRSGQAAAKMDADDRKIRLELLRNRRKTALLERSEPPDSGGNLST